MPQLPGQTLRLRQGSLAAGATIAPSVAGALEALFLTLPDGTRARPAAPVTSPFALRLRQGTMRPVSTHVNPEIPGQSLALEQGSLAPAGGPVLPGQRLMLCQGALGSQHAEVPVAGQSLTLTQGSVTATTTSAVSFWASEARVSWDSGVLGRGSAVMPTLVMGSWNVNFSTMLHLAANRSASSWNVTNSGLFYEDQAQVTYSGDFMDTAADPRLVFRFSETVSATYSVTASRLWVSLGYIFMNYGSNAFAWLNAREGLSIDFAVVDANNPAIHLDTLTVDI